MDGLDREPPPRHHHGDQARELRALRERVSDAEDLISELWRRVVPPGEAMPRGRRAVLAPADGVPHITEQAGGTVTPLA